MTYQLFNLPKATQIDSSVRVTPGARAYFYATTTTTPQNTYTDAARTTPSSNPVVADANGVFAPIYLDPTLLYRLDLKTSADVLIYTVDPCNDQLLSAASIGLYLYPRTAAEISAGVTPTNYAYEQGHVTRYGAVGDGTTNDATAWQTAIDVMYAAGGGFVLCIPGASYKLTVAPTVKDRVMVDLRGATLTLAFPSGSDVYGIQMRNHTAIENGTIAATNLGNPTTASAFFHCNVTVGLTDGLMVGYSGVVIRNLVMTNNRSDTVGGSCIVVTNDSNQVTIDNIEFPSSSVLSSGLRVHWAGDGGSPAPAASRHPYNVNATNLKFGTMTKAATGDISAIDIVAAYNVRISGVTCDRYAGDAVVQVRAGGFGNAVAPATVKPLVYKGIQLESITCAKADNNFITVSGYASGGGAIAAATFSIPVEIDNCKAVGAGGSSIVGTGGMHLTKVYDVIVRNCECEQFYYGAYVEEGTKRCTFEGGRYINSQKQGVAVVHATTPEDITLRRVEAYLNGQDGTNQAGFDLDSCTRVTLEDCVSGDATAETTQFYGFKTSSSALATRIKGRARVRNFKGGGAKYSFSSAITGDYQFSGGSSAAMSTTTTEFYPAVGVGAAGVTTEAGASVLTAVDLTFTNLSFKVTAAPTGATKTRTASLVDDGVATAINPTITDTAVAASDFDFAEVAAGSYISVQSTVANTPAAASGKWSVEAFLT